MMGMTSWDSCYIFEGMDVISTCEDDGKSLCDGSDMCLKICDSNTCDTFLELSGMTVPGYDCDSYRALARNDFQNFTDFGEYFLHDTEMTTITGCPKASSTTKASSKNSSTQIGLIVGIVVGVAVLITVIVAIVIYIRSRKIKNSVEEV